MKRSDGMRVIGLTGGIACGKSNLSRALRENGADVIDADAISHELTREGGEALPAIRALFGDGVFDGESLDRGKLGALVFSDPEKLRALDNILHPLILQKIGEALDALAQSGRKAAVIDAPLLYETGLDKRCDEIWCAYVPQKIQIARVRKRDRLTYAQALLRLRSQTPAIKSARRADRVIDTRGCKEASASHVLSLWNDLLNGEKNP